MWAYTHNHGACQIYVIVTEYNPGQNYNNHGWEAILEASAAACTSAARHYTLSFTDLNPEHRHIGHHWCPLWLSEIHIPLVLFTHACISTTGHSFLCICDEFFCLFVLFYRGRINFSLLLSPFFPHFCNHRVNLDNNGVPSLSLILDVVLNHCHHQHFKMLRQDPDLKGSKVSPYNLIFCFALVMKN